MTTTELVCWKCGTEVRGVPLPVGRGEECPQCVSSLRACRMCTFYDPDAGTGCREPMADPIADREKANTCDYFRPAAAGEEEDDSEAAAARARLNAAFGGGEAPVSGGGLGSEAEAFRTRAGSEADDARRKLEELFGKKDE